MAVPLQWRVFATNAAVLAVATMLLVLTPVTVSFPIALAELVVLVGGLGTMLALDRLGRAAAGDQRAGVEEAPEAVRASLEDVRGIARRLRPEALDDLGLASALEALANDVERQTGVRTEPAIDGHLSGPSAEEELVIYRVAQEALTNAVRHGRAQRVSIRVRRDELVVHDDGVGFDAGITADGTALRACASERC